MTLVFVYGTLKKGGGLHGALSHAEFVGTAILHGFALYNLGWFPGIVPDADGRTHGEVYRVDDATLATLDRIEGTPSLYRREEVSVTVGNATVASLSPQGPALVETYIYNGTVPFEDDEIVSGRWPVDGGEG